MKHGAIQAVRNGFNQGVSNNKAGIFQWKLLGLKHAVALYWGIEWSFKSGTTFGDFSTRRSL